MRNYEPAEFASLLASSKLEEPVDLTLFGLVKADEKDKSVLLFSILVVLRAMDADPRFLDLVHTPYPQCDLQGSSASLCQDRVRRARRRRTPRLFSSCGSLPKRKRKKAAPAQMRALSQRSRPDAAASL